MLAGLEPLNDGHIMIGDRDVSNVRPRARDIAMVFQSYALYPQLTVAENMGFALKQHRQDTERVGGLQLGEPALVRFRIALGVRFGVEDRAAADRVKRGLSSLVCLWAGDLLGRLVLVGLVLRGLVL